MLKIKLYVGIKLRYWIDVVEAQGTKFVMTLFYTSHLGGGSLLPDVTNEWNHFFYFG